MNVWIALWLACVSPDQCVPLQDAANKYFENRKECMVHARAMATEMWQDLKQYKEASIRFICIETKNI